ncbi:hypothetical protein C5167_015698 [Papaver somniferum]|uniref:Uncharacterized protein n=1 Tax=Papaver somniferum TaxID=3469 RepID=A0A4Y7J7Q8_PAPSO|nr:hypothetical protein C5167_015698 [Papaver somniferum]
MCFKHNFGGLPEHSCFSKRLGNLQRAFKKMHIEEVGESSNVKNTEETYGINGIKPNIEPALGMGFESIDDAWEFYKTFGKVTGFPPTDMRI